jgi:hypothetical protein
VQSGADARAGDPVRHADGRHQQQTPARRHDRRKPGTGRGKGRWSVSASHLSPCLRYTPMANIELCQPFLHEHCSVSRGCRKNSSRAEGFKALEAPQPTESYSRPPGPGVDLSIHCKAIQTCCNVIQTLLQLNSNNSKCCAVLIYFAVAAIRGDSRRKAAFGDFSRANAPRNSTPLCGIGFQCLALGRP